MNQCNEISINTVTTAWPITSGMTHCKKGRKKKVIRINFFLKKKKKKINMELSSDSNHIKLTKFTDPCDFITMQGN